MSMKKLTQEEINKIHSDHMIWLLSNHTRRDYAVFDDCILDNLDLSGFRLHHAFFGNNVIIRDCNFSCADLSEAVFGDTILKMNNFTAADLSDVQFIGTTIRYCSFERANLHDVSFDTDPKNLSPAIRSLVKEKRKFEFAEARARDEYTHKWVVRKMKMDNRKKGK